MEMMPLADMSMRRAFTSEHDNIEKEVPSVKEWMIGLSSAESPPGHTPWENDVKDVSRPSSASSPAIKEPHIPLFRFSRCPTVPRLTSSFSFEISMNGCGSTLLDGSLPSTTSSAWSGGLSLPHISKVLELKCQPERAIQPRGPETASARTPPPFPLPPLPVIKPLQPHKGSKCASDMPSRREAHVLDRRLTQEKIEKVPPTLPYYSNSSVKPSSPMDDMLSQIEAFLSDGLTKMDNDMQQLGLEKEKLETPPTPSVVISNSTQVMSLSFDTSQSTHPLAIRRGKKVPGFIEVKSTFPTLEYPGVPTPFRGSPGSASPSFATEPVYPDLTLDMTMSTEEMISSLRAQVESFKPQKRTSERLKEKCDDAFKWFESEIAIDSPGSPLETLVDSLSKSNCSSPSPMSPCSDVERPPTSPTDSIRLTKARASLAPSGRGSLILKNKDIKLPSENLKHWNSPRTKPRSATVSGGSVFIDDRKVRFSAFPPEVIPEDILEKKSRDQADAPNVASADPSKPTPLSLNKPVYRQFTQGKKTPPPTKNGTPSVSGRARAMSTGSNLIGIPRRKKLPPSPLGQVSPVTLRHFSFIGKKGKENKPLKVAGITFSKRKSLAQFDEDGETKPEKPRNSPLQSVLNRFRG